MSAGNPVYSIEALSIRKGQGQHAFRLEVPALQIDRGSALAVAGPSGCGKSSLIDVLALLAQPAAVAKFDFRASATQCHALANRLTGTDSNQLAALRARHIGFVPQVGGLLPALTVLQNVTLPCHLAGMHDTERALVLLERLGLSAHCHKKPARLSVGERQRCAIARALAHKPTVVIADEPTAALDPYNAGEVMGIFRNMADDLGSTLIVVSHDLELVRSFGLQCVPHRFRHDEIGVVSVFGET